MSFKHEGFWQPMDTLRDKIYLQMIIGQKSSTMESMEIIKGKVDINFWKGKKVFLTGHTGFKGSWLSLWLQNMGAVVKGYSLDVNTNQHCLYRQM